MKKIMILILFVTTVTTVFSQSARFGIKGGLNFSSTGDITTISNESFGAENRVGFHIGLLGQFKFSGLFLQPEVVFTRLASEFERGVGIDANYNASQIDLSLIHI